MYDIVLLFCTITSYCMYPRLREGGKGKGVVGFALFESESILSNSSLYHTQKVFKTSVSYMYNTYIAHHIIFHF